MTTILQARSRRFVSTPAVERLSVRALRYLQSGYSVHLRGPAGTGKTTLALHLADLLGRPIMLVFGDDEFKTSDLIGNQSGYTRKKVVDNFIHSVVKVEDELRQNWVDSRLTLACKEGFTLVYDEFNRSRPEVNNVLLSALEEKLLVLPPTSNKSEYIRVHPQFRAIFTSNPEEYYGVHATQDALLDRLVTMAMPEPDELTQQEILVQKVGLDREGALLIVRLIREFRACTATEKASGLRPALIIGKVCLEHQIPIGPDNLEFRDVCSDVLLARTSLPVQEATTLLWKLLDEFCSLHPAAKAQIDLPSAKLEDGLEEEVASAIETGEIIADLDQPDQALVPSQPSAELESTPDPLSTQEQQVYTYLGQSQSARVSEVETALGLDRFQTVNALQSLVKKGILKQRGDFYRKIR
ncbi:gas vesicle protein GvpN [Leptolyngbya sp. 'hensonii']|uniref:gas vesicle protein GvpN n=1 Tax=Leptolyngbya sp. 'hensonii' TaxID=1922337 RepID=UPI00094F5E9E|nr:gas vesicle protein GvpN [Leptolyngbya sp. 'hensonii']OLP18005.1 gas vesicle protein GvpN [Leptolyngbya sp. 'hensonii']